MAENNQNEQESWDMAILAGVVIVLIFMYYYKFLFRNGFDKVIDTSAVYTSELQSI